MKFTLGLLFVDLFSPRLISFQPSACKHGIICLLGSSVESNKCWSLTKPFQNMIMALEKYIYIVKLKRKLFLREKAFRIMQELKFTQLLRIQWEKICMQLFMFNRFGLYFSTQNRYILHKNGIYWFIMLLEPAFLW